MIRSPVDLLGVVLRPERGRRDVVTEDVRDLRVFTGDAVRGLPRADVVFRRLVEGEPSAGRDAAGVVPWSRASAR